MYLVTVIFDVAPAHAAHFLPRVQQQAINSLEEPGCRRFDVWQAPDNAARFFLFEIYDDRDAFDAHLASAHFKAFDAEVADWVEQKAVEIWTLSDG